MSYINIKNSSAAKCISKFGLKLNQPESGEGELSADSWAMSIIKLSMILIIGILVLNGIYAAVGLNNSSAPLYSLAGSVKNSITSGYTMGGLLVLVVGAGAVLHFLGFRCKKIMR
jgi:hypothetical protein